MQVAALILALLAGSSCSHVASGSKNVGATKTTRKKKKNGGGGGSSDLTEDIDFWTRMTQEIGSMPITRKPTARPTRGSTVRPTMRPINGPVPTPPPIPQVPVTPIPTMESLTPVPTPSPATPPPVTPVPTMDSTTPVPTPSPVTTVTPVPTPSPVTPVPTPSPVTSSPTTSEPTTAEPSTSPIGPCGLTPEDRAEQLRQLALTVTDEDTLNDPDSSQSRALEWLINEDVLDPPVCPDDDGPCEAVQRYIMAAFYFAADGGNWDQCNAPENFTPGGIAAANAQCRRVVTPFPVNNPRIGDTSTNAWLTPVDECEWGGLACWGTDDDKNGCMDQIDFENDGLSGTLIPEMNNLKELRFFILEQGTLAGTIPTEYGLFDKLLILDMDFNELTGPIPEELFNMNLLQQLDLNDNKLSGPISTNIGQLTTLTFLQLDHNELNGNIPAEVGEMKNLRIAFFNDNDLTGEMPAEVCANRNNTSPPGLLGTLVTDCNPQDNPEVECSCCSSCNVI